MDSSATHAVNRTAPKILLLNQMAGPMTWELAVDLGNALGTVALLTGHPDTLAKGSRENVQLHRSITYQRGSGLQRAWSWLRYAVHALVWVWKFPAHVPLIAFSNPPIVIWACWLLRWLRGTPYAVMVHDIYPDTAVRLGAASERSLVVRVWRWLNRHAYERASLVMTLGEHMAAHLEGQFDARRTRAGRVIVIPPWADAQALRPIPKSQNWFARKYKQTECLTVMYSGNMGRGHDLETILAAAGRLTDEAKIHFMLIGAGPKWEMVRSQLSQLKYSNVTLLPWQDEAVIPFSLATADLGIVSLEREMTGLAVPSKAYYFLAAGTPLLGICFASSELADTIEQFGCGTRIEPGNVEGLVAILRSLASNPERLTAWREAVAHARQFHSRPANTAGFVQALVDVALINPITTLEHASA